MILFLIIRCQNIRDCVALMMSGAELGVSINAEEADLITAQAETTDDSHLIAAFLGSCRQQSHQLTVQISYSSSSLHVLLITIVEFMDSWTLSLQF